MAQSRHADRRPGCPLSGVKRTSDLRHPLLNKIRPAFAAGANSQNQLVIGGLLCRRDLFDRRSFDVGLVTLFIGLVQEAADDACALLLLGPSFSRFLPLSEELVVDFPAHGIPPSVMEPGHANVAIQTTLEDHEAPAQSGHSNWQRRMSASGPGLGPAG